MADRPECDVEVLDLFVIDDDTGQLRTAEPWERPTPPPLTPPSGDQSAPPQPTEPPAAVNHDQPSAMSIGPAPGQRPAVRPRPIGTHEIFHPVLVAPATAHDLLIDGSLFDGIGALHVDVGRCRTREATMTWPVRVETGRFGKSRRAELCVRPSPSWVLTVVELRPRGHRRRRSRRFLRTGIGVVEELCDRLLVAATTTS